MRPISLKEYVPVTLKPYFVKLNQKYHKNCQEQVLSYAKCLKEKGLEVQEHECQQDFKKLLSCLRT